MFFRRGGSHGRWLQLKMWLFGVGAVVALLGMGLQNDWLIGLAALILLAGVLLRFIDREPEGRPEEE